MPITFHNVQSDLGITVDNCYTVITNYQGDATQLALTVSIYANKEAFEIGKRPVATEMITILISELAKSNIFAYLYDAILTSPLLSHYEPSVIEYPFSVTPTLSDPSVTPDPNDLTVNEGTNGTSI